MTTIVRLEAQHDRINQLFASSTERDIIVIIRAPGKETMSERSIQASASTPLSRFADEEDLITWEDAEWQ
jgi:hypothetical protein